MHIILESDYAVRIVHCLALNHIACSGHDDRGQIDHGQADHGQVDRIDAQTIADRTGVSLRFTLKIMRKLVAADIVKSYKGARGGYTLGREPGDISLRQVIEAVEGPYRFSRCVDGDYDCSCSSACPFHSVYDEVTQLVINKLDTVTFDNIAK